MTHLCHYLVLAIFIGAAGSALSAPAVGSDGHAREELGVNRFTAPSIESILDSLENLKPFSFDSVRRQLPEGTFPNRVQLAMNFGGLIADGFLFVAAENRDDAEALARALIRCARGLGVGDEVIRHGQSLNELAQKGRWGKLRTELAATQSEVERAMAELRDEEIAHLISLGGWLRGLEITSTLVARQYSPARAVALVKPDLLDYFLDRLSTINPSLKRTPLMRSLTELLGAIQTASQRASPLAETDVQEIHRLAVDANRLISRRQK
jgi:hypothetical protein